jgi:hypothetical protein
MRRFKMIGIWMGFAAFAIGLFGAGTAMAVDNTDNGPEYGICKKNTATLHQYKDVNCEEEVAAGTGKFEWKPGPNGAKGAFKATTGAAKLFLKTAGTTVECVSSESAGKVTSTTESEVPVVKFKTCKSAGEPCHSTNPLGVAEEIKTLPLKTKLGLIADNTEQDSVGEDFTGTAANTGHLAEFECGKVAVKVKGSLVCAIKPIDLKPTSTNGELFCKETSFQSGVQEPENFEGQPKDTLITELSVAPGTEFGSTQETKAHVLGKLWIRA